MKDNLPRYTLRVSQVLLDKLAYIAEYEGRTKNKELEQLIKKRIAEFESEHGTIDTSKLLGVFFVCPHDSGKHKAYARQCDSVAPQFILCRIGMRISKPFYNLLIGLRLF